MNCLIVTDSGKSVGNGHISRCRILAEELKSFFKLTIISDLNYLKKEKGVNFLKTNNLNLTSKIKKKINLTKYHLIIIDSYRKLNLILKFMKQICANIFIFDDYLLLKNHKYNIINQNPFFTRDNYSNNKKRFIFAGKDFTLIDKKLFKIKPSFKKLKILVTCGMYDQKNKLPKIVDFLILLSFIYKQKFNVTIYLNKNAKNIRVIKKKIINYKFFKIKTDQKNYLKSISKSNLCISPLGVSVWERIYCGVPTMTFPIDRHQLRVFNNLVNKNYVLPFYINNTNKNLELFKNELSLKKKLRNISFKGKELFSKKNKKKLVKKIADISKYYIQKNNAVLY